MNLVSLIGSKYIWRAVRKMGYRLEGKGKSKKRMSYCNDVNRHICVNLKRCRLAFGVLLLLK